MPIYEYQCKACGHQMEVLQRMSDDLLTDCDACGESQLRKLVSAAAFRLKGTGWYETDFKNGSKSNLKSSAQSNESTKENSSEADKPKSTESSKSDGESNSSSAKTSENKSAPSAN